MGVTYWRLAVPGFDLMLTEYREHYSKESYKSKAQCLTTCWFLRWGH